MPKLIRKVLAYITWEDTLLTPHAAACGMNQAAFGVGNHRANLLVFSHPDFPEAGIQVPAGTIEPGEEPEAAVLREAFEETGLIGLTLVAPLGERMRDVTPFGKDELHHRYFFHLRYDETPPQTWRHWEEFPSDGSERVAFDFFWAQLPDGVPPLIAGHDAHLLALLRSMGLPSA
jgi:8-oxo-dGTP pyrophosphatase MutT (NUDIX family)